MAALDQDARDTRQALAAWIIYGQARPTTCTGCGRASPQWMPRGSANSRRGSKQPSALAHQLSFPAARRQVIEDTGTPREELGRAFGYEVALLVAVVSREKGPSSVTTQLSNQKIREVCRTSGDDRPASLKLADKIANVRRSKASRPDLYAMYLTEQPAFSAALEEEGLGDPRLWRMLAEAFGA